MVKTSMAEGYDEGLGPAVSGYLFRREKGGPIVDPLDHSDRHSRLGSARFSRLPLIHRLPSEGPPIGGPSRSTGASTRLGSRAVHRIAAFRRRESDGFGDVGRRARPRGL